MKTSDYSKMGDGTKKLVTSMAEEDKQKIRWSKTTYVGQIWPDLLLPFTDDYSVQLTASTISRKTKILRRTASRMLDALAKTSAIRYSFEGKNKKYYLDLREWRTKMLISFVEHYKALKFSFEQPAVFVMLEEIARIRDTILFGSYAQGTPTPESDVDILVLGNKSTKITEIIRRQPLQINPHFSSTVEFEKLVRNKNPLAAEIIKNHLIFGNCQFIDICWRFHRHEL